MFQPVNHHRVCQASLLFLVAWSAVPVYALTENFVPGMADYVFYTFIISVIAFSVAVLLAIGPYRWLVYSLFAALLALSNTANGGVISYLLGPTDFNLFVVPYLIFGALTSYGLWMVGWLLDADHALSRYKNLFYALAVIAAIGPLTSYFWLMKIRLDYMWIPQHILYGVMILGQILPPLTWHKLTTAQRRITRFFPPVIALFAFLFFGGQYFFNLSPDELNLFSRVNIAIFSSFMLMLVLWQAFATSKEKEHVERQILESAKEQAELKVALLESEQQYAKAREVAAQQNTQLAKVSHDLKQPIAALRMAVNSMEPLEDRAGALNRAIDYVDQLAQSFNGNALDDAQLGEEDAEALGSGDGAKEIVSSELFAESLIQMFADEAHQQGVDLRVAHQFAQIDAAPLATMRIFTNVVSNALAHANATRILVTFRKRTGRLVFESRDNGAGMSKEVLAHALEKGGKGEHSNGDGLGLSIVQDLSTSQGFAFAIESTPNQGTKITIDLGAYHDEG